MIAYVILLRLEIFLFNRPVLHRANFYYPYRISYSHKLFRSLGSAEIDTTVDPPRRASHLVSLNRTSNVMARLG